MWPRVESPSPPSANQTSLHPYTEDFRLRGFRRAPGLEPPKSRKAFEAALQIRARAGPEESESLFAWLGWDTSQSWQPWSRRGPDPQTRVAAVVRSVLNFYPPEGNERNQSAPSWTEGFLLQVEAPRRVDSRV